MNEEEKTGRTVARLLNSSLTDVTPGTLYRLQAARRAALEHYQPAEKVVHAGAGISAQGGHHHWFSAHAGRLLLTASLLLFLAIHSYLQMNNRSENTLLAPTILISDPPAGSQEIEDTANEYEAADEGVVEETIFRETVDNDDYGEETNTSETESDVSGTADADDVTDSFDSTEIQETENTAEVPYTADHDQDVVTEEDGSNVASDHLQNPEYTVNSSDTENMQSSTDITDE